MTLNNKIMEKIKKKEISKSYSNVIILTSVLDPVSARNS